MCLLYLLTNLQLDHKRRINTFIKNTVGTQKSHIENIEYILIIKKFNERVRILLRFEKHLLTKKCYQCPVHLIFSKRCNWRRISKLA